MDGPQFRMLRYKQTADHSREMSRFSTLFYLLFVGSVSVSVGIVSYHVRLAADPSHPLTSNLWGWLLKLFFTLPGLIPMFPIVFTGELGLHSFANVHDYPETMPETKGRASRWPLYS